jgi:multisubunit Na+/H+ antiporter MnhE subunit
MSVARRVKATFSLLGAFAFDIVASSVAVARIALSPGRPHRPAIVAVPVDAETRWGVVLFAYLVSLTPGSTCLHVADEMKFLYVHFLDAPDTVARAAEVKALYEERIIRMEGREARVIES